MSWICDEVQQEVSQNVCAMNACPQHYFTKRAVCFGFFATLGFLNTQARSFDKLSIS
jgi:hypothetical protein